MIISFNELKERAKAELSLSLHMKKTNAVSFESCKELILDHCFEVFVGFGIPIEAQFEMSDNAPMKLLNAFYDEIEQVISVAHNKIDMWDIRKVASLLETFPVIIPEKYRDSSFAIFQSTDEFTSDVKWMIEFNE